MSTDLESLRGLARLARLELTEEELRALAPELERILEAFGTLARHAPGGPPPADLRGLEPRDDAPLPFPASTTLVSAAAESEDGFFAVPKTVGGEG